MARRAVRPFARRMRRAPEGARMQALVAVAAMSSSAGGSAREEGAARTISVLTWQADSFSAILSYSFLLRRDAQLSRRRRRRRSRESRLRLRQRLARARRLPGGRRGTREGPGVGARRRGRVRVRHRDRDGCAKREFGTNRASTSCESPRVRQSVRVFVSVSYSRFDLEPRCRCGLISGKVRATKARRASDVRRSAISKRDALQYTRERRGTVSRRRAQRARLRKCK